jgi:hypothetical protein
MAVERTGTRADHTHFYLVFIKVRPELDDAKVDALRTSGCSTEQSATTRTPFGGLVSAMAHRSTCPGC